MSDFQKAKIFSPHLPWCQDDSEQLGAVVTQFALDQETFRRKWCQKWFENVMFIYGNQSIRWSQRYDFAVDVDFLKRDSPLSQRSQTNIARTVLEALASMIYGNLPIYEADTAEESSMKGKRFKKIAEKILDAYATRLCMHKELHLSAVAFAAFGQIGGKIDWNPNAGELIKVPQWRKVRAPIFTTGMQENMYLGGLLETPIQAVDSNGQPLMEERWEPITDSSGNQVQKEILTGDLRYTLLTPFEYMREVGSHGMHKSKYIEHIRLLDYDEYLAEYKNEPGKTRDFKNVAPVQADTAIHSFAVRHFMRLQYVTPPNLVDASRRSENIIKSALFKNKILVIEHYDRPTENWPQGRKLIVANGRCTHITQPNYHTGKLGGWHPFVEAQWLTVAPSSMATGPLNDVIAKNRENNIKDSLIATSLRRNFGGVTLIKTVSGLDPQKLSGEPGQILECNDPTMAMSHITDPNPIPAVLGQLKQQDKDEIYEVSGAGDAIRGDRSKGMSAGYALKQQQEREEKRLTPAQQEFEFFVAELGEKKLACLKANALQLNSNVMGFLQRSAAGEFKPQDIVAFLSNPIDYGIAIKVGAGSMKVKSKASMQATLMELAKGVAGNRIGNDAQVLDAFLKYFDVDTLRDGSAPHRDRAIRENETLTDYGKLGMDAAGITLPLVMFEDDDDIHIATHTQFVVENADELLSNEELLRVTLLHLEQHRIQKKEKAGEVPVGSTLQVPQMMAEARQRPPATMPMIHFQTQQKQAQQQQKMVEAEQNNAIAKQAKQQDAMQAQPKAPTDVKPIGQPGAAPKDPNAPSINTAPTAQGGVQG